MIGQRRWTPRRLTGMATIGTIIVVTGLLTGAGSAIGQQKAHGHFTYTCQFPSGRQSIGVDITAAFPSSGAVGQAVHPASGTVTFSVPHDALGELTASHAATVSGIGQLNTTVAQNGRSEKATWANLIASPKPVPTTGDLVLTAPSTAPTITPRAPGDITFEAAALTMVLTPKRADGSATEPATVLATCTPDAGQHALLATVPVPAVTATPGEGSGGPLAVGSTPGAARSALADDGTDTPADCGIVPGVYPDDTLGLGLCGFLSGFSNVNKLDAASLIGPQGAFFNGFGPYALALQCPADPDAPNAIVCIQDKGVVHVLTCSFAQFDNNGTQFELPPTRATFLAFGFVPVTATMHLTQSDWPPDHLPTIDPKCTTGFVHVQSFPFTFPKKAITIVADDVNTATVESQDTRLETYLSVRISDATVNGTTLNVGPTCETKDPVHSVIVASSQTVDGVQSGYTFVDGGPVTGTLDIPSFTGCGVGEDLDPLFNASVSGNDNFLKLTQAPLCTPSTGIGCPPQVPTPQR